MNVPDIKTVIGEIRELLREYKAQAEKLLDEDSERDPANPYCFDIPDLNTGRFEHLQEDTGIDALDKLPGWLQKLEAAVERDNEEKISLPGTLLREFEETPLWTGEALVEGPEGVRLHEIIQCGQRRNSGPGYAVTYTFYMPRDRESLMHLGERVDLMFALAKQDGDYLLRAVARKAAERIHRLLSKYPESQAR